MTCRLKKIATVVATLTFAAPNLAYSGNEPAFDLSQAANLVAQQQYPQAIELYTEILNAETAGAEDRGAAYFQRGIAEQEIGMTGHAIADFTQAIWLGHLGDKELAIAHFRRGKGYALLKQYSRAITDFDRAIQLEPAYAQAYSERGDAYRNRGIYKLALQDYGTSIRLLNPELHIPYFGRGLTHEAMGNDRLAAADFRRATELEPEFSLAAARVAGPSDLQLEATGDIGSAGTEAQPAEVTAEDAVGGPEFADAGSSSGPAQTDAGEKALPAATATVHVAGQPPLEADNAAPTNAENIVEKAEVASIEPELSRHAGPSAGGALNSVEPSVKRAASNEVTEQSDTKTAEAPLSTETSVPAPAGENVAAQDSEAHVASNVTKPHQTIDAEATGAIRDVDRAVTASEIREQQTAEATSIKVTPSGQTAGSGAAETKTDKMADQAPRVAALAPATKDGKFLVQIASYREKDDALRRFDTLSSQHGDLLSDLSPDIFRADLGDKGVYYRLRIGPFQSFQSSTDLCNALKARQLDCLVIKRKTAG